MGVLDQLASRTHPFSKVGVVLISGNNLLNFICIATSATHKYG